MTTRESVEPRAVQRLKDRLRGLLSMLALAFLLGMGANLIGLPDENQGVGLVVSIVLIALHALIGIGLVVTAFLAMPAARAAGVGRREVLIGLIAIIVTFLAGIGTVMTGSGWLSFVMAVGFLVAAIVYVVAAVAAARADTAAGADTTRPAA